jgi:hypothetical protein
MSVCRITGAKELHKKNKGERKDVDWIITHNGLLHVVCYTCKVIANLKIVKVLALLLNKTVNM